MKLLAVDTSSEACSVALFLDGDLGERHEVREREHTRLVVPMIAELLSGAGVTPAGLDAIVLGNGPGSFIGMRIAASLVQGIAFAAGRPVVPVSSLLAVAEAVFESEDCDEVVVTQDAHMQQVYLGRFERHGNGVVSPVTPARLHGQSRIDGLDADRVTVAAGAGWSRYPELLAANRSAIAGTADVAFPSARYLLPEARRRVELGDVIDPAEVEPCYLREEVAARPAQP